MQISNVINSIQTLSRSKIGSQIKNKITPSFKSVFVEDVVNLGDVAERNKPHTFLAKDALLLNEIAAAYPNQDCYIKKGYAGFPRIEFREKPPEVQVFTETRARQYKTAIDYKDKEYPVEPLILYPDSNLNRFIGMTSYVSLNPSLPYTIKAGYELHKKLLDKKYKIMDVIGKNDNVNLGSENVIQKAHKAVEDVEAAVTRYLLECSYAALSDRASARQLYGSNYPKVQTRLSAKRKLDLTTSLAKQPTVTPKEGEENLKLDICEVAMNYYPRMDENKKRIEELSNYMASHRIMLG